MVAAHQMFASGGGGGWANPYIADGMVSCYEFDGTKFVDRLGGMDDAVLTSGSVELSGLGAKATSNSTTFRIEDNSALCGLMCDVVDTETSGVTLEMCYDITQCSQFSGSWSSGKIFTAGATDRYSIAIGILFKGEAYLRSTTPTVFVFEDSSRYLNGKKNLSISYSVDGTSVDALTRDYGTDVSQITYDAKQKFIDAGRSNWWNGMKEGGSYRSWVTTLGSNILLYNGCVLNSIRLYDRALTSAERSFNYAVDKAKFG